MKITLVEWRSVYLHYTTPALAGGARERTICYELLSNSMLTQFKNRVQVYALKEYSGYSTSGLIFR